MPIPPEDVAFLKAQGWSDAQIAQTQPIGQVPSTQTNTTSALGTIPAVAKAHLGSYLGGGVGAIGGGALVGALSGSEVPGIGNIIGGIAGGLLGAYGGQKAQQAVESPDTYQSQQDTANQAEEAHPLIGAGTDITLSALASGGAFSPKTALKGIRDLLGGSMTSEAKEVLLQSGLNPAINTGLSFAQGQGVPSLSSLAEESLGGALFSKSWLPSGRFNTTDEPPEDVNNQTKALVGTNRGFTWNRPDNDIIDVHPVTGEPIVRKQLTFPENRLNAPQEQNQLAEPAKQLLLNAPIEHLDEVQATLPDGKEVNGHIIGTDEKSGNPILLDQNLQQHILPEKELQNAIQKPSTSSILPYTSEGTGEAGSEHIGMGQGNKGNEIATTQPTSQEKGLPNTKETIGRDPTLHLDYSPEDLAKYKELQPKTVPKTLDDMNNPDFQKNWQEFEALRNKYNGNPPKQIVEQKQEQPSFTDNLVQKLENLKSGVSGSGQLHAFGILPDLWDRALTVAQTIIRTGGKVSDAIEAAIDHIKKNSEKAKLEKFNEKGARESLKRSLEFEQKNTKQVTPESLNLPKDRYMGKIGQGFRAVADKVRDIGTPIAKKLADNFKLALNRKDELTGRWKNPIVREGKKLSAYDREVLDRTFQRERETGKFLGKDMLTNDAQRRFYNLVRDKLNESGQHQKDIGEPITLSTVSKTGKTAYIPRDIKQNPTYYPEMPNQKTFNIYRNNTDHEVIAKLDKEFDDYNVKTLKMSEEASKERLDAFKTAMRGSVSNSDVAHQDYFNARRKAQGIPLPPSFRETDPVRNLERYFDRASTDAAHYEYLERDPQILSALGQTRDAWGNQVNPELVKQNNIVNNPSVRAALKQWTGEFRNPAQETEEHISSLASSLFISGPALEAHKIISNVVKTLSQAPNPVVLTKAIISGIKNINQGYETAVKNNVMKLSAVSISKMVSGTATAGEKLQATARLVRRVATLNDLTTKFNAGLLQAMNEAIIPSKISRAADGCITCQKFLKNLDPSYDPKHQYTDEEVQKLASLSANYIHGTGDIRSLPAWMLNDSEFSGFFSLAHWSIAQTNNFMRDVYEPATRGDVKPLLTGIFGAAIGGYLIKELRQDIQGKKNPIPSLSEIASSDRGLQGNTGLLAYNLIAAMQYSGFGGLLSQVAKYPFDAVYKNEPMGATFPLDEIASDLAGTLHNVQEAIANDPHVNWIDLAAQVGNHILSTDIQLSRIAINQGIDKGLIHGLPAEKKELSDKLNQLRRFDMVEGLPYQDIDSSSNPYLNLEQKEFKLSDNPQEAIQQLPSLIHSIFTKYAGEPDVLLSKLKALKENQFSTFPSLQQMPLSFLKYVNYLNREEGPQQAQAELQDYMHHKLLNEVKSSVVP